MEGRTVRGAFVGIEGRFALGVDFYDFSLGGLLSDSKLSRLLQYHSDVVLSESFNQCRCNHKDACKSPRWRMALVVGSPRQPYR